MKTVLQTLLLCLISCGWVFAQDITHTITCEIQNVAEIRFEPGAPQVTTYSFTDADDYDNNVASNNGANLQVACNKDWTINVRAGSSNFTYSGPHTNPNMPSTVLKVRNTPASRIGITPTDQSIATGAPGSFTDNEVQLRYIAVPKFDYPDGTYTIEVIYTLTNS